MWVCGDAAAIDQKVRDLARCRGMVVKYNKIRESLSPAKKLLLQSEEIREEELVLEVRKAVDVSWKLGKFYFRREKYEAKESGSFASAVAKTAETILPTLFRHFDTTTIVPSELSQLLEVELNGPSIKFMEEHLGILELDSGRYVPACSGVVPRRIQEYIGNEDGVGGGALLQHFGRPPYGYRPETVKACVAGLLRGSKIKIQSPDGGGEITAIRDAGVTDLFSRDRDFKRADFFPIGDDDVGYQAKARICKMLAEHLGVTIDPESHLIADAVASRFPQQAVRLRNVLGNLDSLPGRPEPPAELTKLQSALEACLKSIRQTKPTVLAVKRHLDSLRDGIQQLNVFEAQFG